jgi:hypothetical protein
MLNNKKSPSSSLSEANVKTQQNIQGVSLSCIAAFFGTTPCIECLLYKANLCSFDFVLLITKAVVFKNPIKFFVFLLNTKSYL